LAGIAISQDCIRVGGGVTWSAIARARLPRCCEALQHAAREVGSVQIQNVATIAGNLCNASPAADGVPPLLALNASVEIAGVGGVRLVPLSQFLQGYRRTTIAPMEIVTAVIIPTAPNLRSAFIKLGLRRYLVISIAMVAVAIYRNGAGRVTRAAVAVGGCSAVAQRLAALEDALVGTPAVEGLSQCVLDHHLEALTPIDDIRASASYRRVAARVLVQRAIEACVAGE
jgi:CO/xanthine dehydrogenase FAD-binding subunit